MWSVYYYCQLAGQAALWISTMFTHQYINQSEESRLHIYAPDTVLLLFAVDNLPQLLGTEMTSPHVVTPNNSCRSSKQSLKPGFKAGRYDLKN